MPGASTVMQAIRKLQQEAQTAMLGPLREALQGTEPSIGLNPARPSFLDGLSRRPSTASVRLSISGRQLSISRPPDTPGQDTHELPFLVMAFHRLGIPWCWQTSRCRRHLDSEAALRDHADSKQQRKIGIDD